MEIRYSVIIMDQTVFSSQLFLSSQEDWKEEIIGLIEDLRASYGTWANIQLSLPGV